MNAADSLLYPPFARGGYGGKSRFCLPLEPVRYLFTHVPLAIQKYRGMKSLHPAQNLTTRYAHAEILDRLLGGNILIIPLKNRKNT